ncbi:MAG: fasciclin domain-containing protein [Prevotella sp.]|nr:fasciclin domain-containing protein [Prevotella sp.]
MKKSKYIGMAMMAAGLLAATSCTDFSDYNEASTEGVTASASQTLWENIQQNPQLSDFEALVRKAGFDENLKQTQYYTVWAPLNGTYDASEFQNLNNDALLRQFVQNHIASYAHSASGEINERILMLNEKSYNFTGSSSYTFDEVAVSQPNLPSSNGLLHTLNGVATFYPNLYEYVTDATLSAGKDLDSLRQFFQKYETTYLDTDASVKGSIVDGMQTYVDSVIVTLNTLWETLRAKIQEEDSTYTFLLPTNKAWSAAYDRISAYYNYLPSTAAQSFNGANLATLPNVNIDADFWKDSLACRYLTRNLIYSNNDAYNQWMVKEPSLLGSDTLRSTTRSKLSNPADILAQTVQTMKMSNGRALIVDSLAFYPWETYAPERIYSATNRDYQGRILTGNAQTVRVSNPDPTKVDVSELTNGASFSYLWVEPNGGYAKPELDIFLPEVLSTTYDFYCIFVPQSVELGDSTPTLPNRVVFTLNYCDETGALKEYTFLDESDENINAFQEEFKLTDNATNRQTIRAFSNDTSKVDTLYLGEFTFPVCYYGLGDGYCPNIKITSPFSVFNAKLLSSFSRDLRIAGIILKPKELVEFEESNKK